VNQNYLCRNIFTMHEEKQELIEMFGIHFEHQYNIAPLAARILGFLIIDGCKSGLTFEELVSKLKASKSSISTNLNLLQKMNLINYFTLSGDRKKYFKAAPLSQRLKNYLTLVDSEKILIERVISYREKNISCTQENVNLQNSYAYKEHILKVEELLNNSINKFKEIEIQNQQSK
jgi:DNA-binding transcriptional regulator GbsR (MarR family)